MKKLFLVVLLLAGCGGGGGGPQPLGLFDGQQPGPNQNLADGQVGESSKFLSVSDVAMEANFTQGGSAGQSLELAPSFGLEKFLSSVGKSTDIRLSTQCRLIDSVTEECTARAQGQTSGDLDAVLTTHLTESTFTRLAGTVDFLFNFNRFTFEEKACGTPVSADGKYRCRLDVVAELVDENTVIDFRFNGLCNTADDPDHLMEITVGDQTHKVGYDLALDFQVRVPYGETRNVYLNEATITGTVQVDGTNHAYGDLRAVLGKSCGQ